MLDSFKKFKYQDYFSNYLQFYWYVSFNPKQAGGGGGVGGGAESANRLVLPSAVLKL